ncbi:MAG: hypothetical protein WA208_11770 [Thermoanaerobaculia bacterium]
MPRVTVLLVSLCFAASAFGVAPQFWSVNSADSILRGEIQGFAVTSRGELRAASAFEKVASFTDPFVLSQATGAGSDRFFGTGNDGKLYRLRGKELKVLFTAPEPEIYAVAYGRGSVFAATSPHGKIYRIDPESGSHTVFHDPGEAYIWALAFLPGGDLIAATGVEGKLFRISPKGEGKVLYDSPDTHLRSLAVRSDGTILVGAASKGRIYLVTPDGSGRALFDSPLSEITALHVMPNGEAWAAGVASALPSTAPAKPQGSAKPASGQQQTGATTSTGGEPKKDDAAGSVDVTFSFEDTSASTSAQPTGASEVYRITSDGYVETMHRFEREMVFGLGSAANGELLLSTGPNGRVYQLGKDDVALVAVVPEKQVVSVSTSAGATVITTTNAGAVYRMTGGPSSGAELRSEAKDLERYSNFGTYTIEGRHVADGALTIAFRSGNTRTPDATWTDWTAPQATLTGKVTAPPARYLQWKLTLAKPDSSAIVDGITVAYVNRNVAPAIDTTNVYEPGVIFVSSSFPPAPQVLEATNPDENGIFNTLDTPRDRSPAEQGKRMFRKGYRTVAWRARDANGDELRYALSFRRKGSDTWLRLRDEIRETQVNFDTSQLPDGRYELRLVASDAPSNADQPLTDSHEDIEFDVDNTPPKFTVTTSADSVTIRVTDAGSPVLRAEYAIDADKWVHLTPVDGIADSRDESFRLARAAVAGKFVIVRVIDASYNVATEAVAQR